MHPGPSAQVAHLADGFAERWEHSDGNEILTFVMATPTANKFISAITDRMPAILPPEQWATRPGKTKAPLSEVKAPP